MPEYIVQSEDKTPEDILQIEVEQHYNMWTQDNRKRTNRKNGWNDITDAYYGVLPKDWPYLTRIVDPRIRTSLIEKNGRLINGKLRGRLAPRDEYGDALKGSIQNAVLDYQWDTANVGGSMFQKVSISDTDARLYASKFALVPWRYLEDEEGNVLFEGNDLIPLDIRDCGMDSTCSHVSDAFWFQARTWELLKDMKDQVDAEGNPYYDGLEEIDDDVTERTKKSSSRNNAWQSRVKQIRGLEDRTGQDRAFPVVEKVIEYRRGKWITFLPEHGFKIIKETKNLYDHKKIPVAQLRYYSSQDDPIGESEVEAVLPLWKAIQACICSYMDEVILKMRPPLKIIEGMARIETIQYGPEAQWLVDDPNAVTEMLGGGQSIEFFQTTYSSLVSAFNTAMGDLSQGVSNIDNTQMDKTATEIKYTEKQQNVRDQKNQNDLAEFLKDIMMMWVSNNKQFLFSDPSKTEYVVRIIGQEQMSLFKKAGMDQQEVMPEAMQAIGELVAASPEMSDYDIMNLLAAGSTPKYPVVENPREKDPEKIKIKSKLRMNEEDGSAELSVVPEDLEGTYDYIPDVKSMEMGQSETLSQARQQAITLFTSNPVVLQLLQQEGYAPQVKEILADHLEDMGLSDADRFFKKLDATALPTAQTQQGTPQAGNLQMGGAQPNMQIGGLPQLPQANTPIGLPA